MIGATAVSAWGILTAVVVTACTDVAPDRAATPLPRPSPTSTAEPPRPTGVDLAIAATGDVLVHSPIAVASRLPDSTRFDFDPVFDLVRPTLRRADLALCHLETPLSRSNLDLSYYPVFRVPRGLARALANAGYDYCSTASNHAMDAGLDGIDSTLDLLDRAGIAHDGTARTRREAAAPATLKVDGVQVALFSYTYGLNGFAPPAGAEWAVNLIDARRILDDARRARRRGAELVIVSMHWGVEYVVEPTAYQRSIARRLLRSGAVDVIIGHHAHVVQPVERIHGRIVAYGLGNFVSNQSAACCPAPTQDGVILHLRVRGRPRDLEIPRVLYTPTWMSHSPYQVVPIGRSSRVPALLRESRARTRRAVRMLGARPRVTTRGFATRRDDHRSARRR